MTGPLGSGRGLREGAGEEGICCQKLKRPLGSASGGGGGCPAGRSRRGVAGSEPPALAPALSAGTAASWAAGTCCRERC